MARIAVVAAPPSAELIASRLAALGHEVATCGGAPEAMALVRGMAPHAAIVAVHAPSQQLRRLIERMRAAAEAALPVVLVLPEGAWWLRVPPREELAPLVTLRDRAATAEALEEALRRLTVGPVATPRSALSMDTVRRRLRGPEGSTTLTPSEAAVLRALLAAPGELVALDVLCDSIWGQRHHDRGRLAALRTHVHTLRAKLEAVGAADALVTEPGAGYRLVG